MANRRITKEIARIAAEDMKNAVYKEKINKAKAELQKEVDAFVRNYIPSPVLACVEEFKDFFVVGYCVSIHCYEKRTKEGEWSGSYRYIPSNTSVPLPMTHYSGYRIDTTRKECKQIIAADDALHEIYGQADKFKIQIENTLLSLKTEKKITEQFPEALPYIKFPDDKSNLPSPIFSDIRAMLQNVTNNKQ